MFMILSGALAGALLGGILSFILRGQLSSIARIFVIFFGLILGGWAGSYLSEHNLTHTDKGIIDNRVEHEQGGIVQRSDMNERAYDAPEAGAASRILLSALIEKDETFIERLESEPDVETRNADEYAFTVGIAEALAYLPRASDESIVTLIEGQAITTEHLLKTDPKICYQWLYGGYGFEEFDFVTFSEAVGEKILKLQFVLHARMVESAGEDIPIYDTEVAAAAVSRANFQMLQVAGIENTGLITGDYGPRGDTDNKQQDYKRACTARIALFQALLNDPLGASAIRHLFIHSQ